MKADCYFKALSVVMMNEHPLRLLTAVLFSVANLQDKPMCSTRINLEAVEDKIFVAKYLKITTTEGGITKTNEG